MRKFKDQLKYLRLINLLENLEHYQKEAEKKQMSCNFFLKYICKKEYEYKIERARLARIAKAKIPENYSIETFPFTKQSHLNKKRLMERYDSLDYITKNRNIVFIGPAGAGKTGLATCFLINAINNGYSGQFITFYDLMDELYKSQADSSEKNIINKYSRPDCLVIDELGYLNSNRVQAGLFFSLMQQRYKKSCTIVTTNLGFKEWEGFLKDKHLTAALLDRLTDNGHIINMKKCTSIRPEPDID